MRHIAVVLLLAAALTASAERRRAVTPNPRSDGPCSVRGLANVFYSSDGGKTWSRNAETPSRTGIWDIVALDTDPETLLAVVSRNVYDSTDGGCTWTLRHTIGEEIKHTVFITPAVGRRAFIYAEEFLLRYDAGEVVALNKPATIGGIGADPGNRDHVRMLDKINGVTRDSFDGGVTWQIVGTSAGGSIGAAAFDPRDFDHIIAGVATRGIAITRNAGRSWQTGASSRTVCSLDFAGNRPDVLWVTTVIQAGSPSIHRTSDGTRLDPIADITGVENSVCLPIIANPNDPNIAYIAIPGRDIGVIDAAQKSVTSFACCGGTILRFAFSSRDPARMFAFAIPR